MGGDGSATGGPPGAPPGSLIGSHGGGSSIGGERVGTRYSIERLEFQTKIRLFYLELDEFAEVAPFTAAFNSSFCILSWPLFLSAFFNFK